MAKKKLVYPPIREAIRLGRGKPPSGMSTYREPAPCIVTQQRTPAMTRELVQEIRRRSRGPLRPVSRRSLALVDRALEKLGVKKRQAADGLRTGDQAIVVFELVPPYREARIGIVLHALDVPWLKEKGELTIREDRVYAGVNIVAKIIFCRRPR